MLSLAKALPMQELKGPFLSLCPLIDRLQFRSSNFLVSISVSLDFLPHTVNKHLAIPYLYKWYQRSYIQDARLVVYLFLFSIWAWACFRLDFRSHVPGIRDCVHILISQGVMASFFVIIS